MDDKLVAAFTTICREDERWLDQYLAEVDRMGVKFAIYLDRCSLEARKRLIAHPFCIGWVEQNDPRVEYHEMAKQAVLDLVRDAGYRWAMSWDSDETFERSAPRKLPLLEDVLPGVLSVSVRWLCLWDSPDRYRADGIFAESGFSHRRSRFFRLDSGNTWTFMSSVVYGPSLLRGNGMSRQPLEVPEVPWHQALGVSESEDLRCLHWGYLTRELRELHKARWDHNYGIQRDGKNPYGTWDWMLDEETNPPVTEEVP